MPATPRQRSRSQALLARQGIRVSGSSRATASSRNRIEKLLDALSTGQFAAAGVAEEFKRREEGFAPRPFGRVVKRAIRERRSFTEVTGSLGKGIFLDVIIDPINLIPGGAIVGAGSKIAKFGRLPQLLKKIDDVTESYKSLRAVKVGAIKTLGGTAGFLKRQNSQKFADAQAVLQDRLSGLVPEVAKEFHRIMDNLVPTSVRKTHLMDLLGDRPVSATQAKRLQLAKGDIPQNLRGAGSPEFQAQFAALSEKEKDAFVAGVNMLEKIEARRIAVDVLDIGQAAGFIKANATNYVPWRTGSKSYAIERLTQMIEASKAGDDAVFGRWSLKQMEDQLEIFQRMPEHVTFADQIGIRNFYRQEFRQKRVRKGKPSAFVDIQTDVAAVLSSEFINTERLASSIDYVKTLGKMVDDLGLAFTDDLLGSPNLLPNLQARLGKVEGLKRAREGMKPIGNLKRLPKDVQEIFKGKIYPASIADELGNVVGKYTDPEFIEAFFKKFAKVQNFWKAWTLSAFPAYHARNIISNLWNNALAGMDFIEDPIGVLQDYQLAWKIRMGKTMGKLDDTHKIAAMGNRTEKELVKLMMDRRVIAGGQFTGELGQFFGTQMAKGNFLRTVADPRLNPVVVRGFRFGRFMEDHARAAHFINRVRKGDSVDDAVKSVHKFLFDYQYGLSTVEQKLFRNFAMPFYAWTRFNMPLQLEMLVHKPRQFARAGKVFRTIEDQHGAPEPNEIFLADWMKEALAIRWNFNKKKGVYEYFIMDSWWPGADLNKFLSFKEFRDTVKNMTSPFIKTPGEIIFNWNTFTGRKISQFPGQTVKVRVTPKALGGVSFPLEARAHHFVRNFRPFAEHDKITQTIDELGWVAALRRLFGVKTYPVDILTRQKGWVFVNQKKLSFFKQQLKRAKREGNQANIRLLEKAIPEIEQLIKENK